MADNVLKFRQPPKKPPTGPGKPSLLAAIIIALVTIAIVVAGSAFLSGLVSAGS